MPNLIYLRLCAHFLVIVRRVYADDYSLCLAIVPRCCALTNGSPAKMYRCAAQSGGGERQRSELKVSGVYQ